MGILADRILPQIREAAADRIGVEIIDRREAAQLRESFVDFQSFREEASELAYHSLGYFTGRPSELRPERRNRLAMRSRIALMQDPLAGAEADLLANFAFGKGIGMPDAEDPDVQEAIEEAWTDPVNAAKLTSFEAQRHRSNELITQANLFPAAYVRGGKVRLGFLDADRVVEIICDPDDDERPLWYAYAEPTKPVYDFTNDRYKSFGEEGTLLDNGLRGRIVYYPHWRNVEDVRKERKDAGLEPVEEPPADRVGKGLVDHTRINRIGRSQFGTPPWARTLRFYSAMNELTDAHVSMAQAASSFIAKRTMVGSPETVTKAANSILAQTGEIGAARFGEGIPPADLQRRGLGGPPPAPGSFWVENESHKLESLSLNSGSAQAMQTSQIVRAPIAAASGFGQHYLGDTSTANLSTATSLELPTLMTVQAWQETARQLLTWFVDMIIQAKVRSGAFGGEEGEALTDLGLNELHIQEAAQRADVESRTGKKLGYKFAMPFPGRRNLPDVASLVTTVATTYDPGGNNIPMRRALLLFLAQHGLNEDDPSGWVDEVLPEEVGDAIASMALSQQRAAATAANAAQQADQVSQQAQLAQAAQQNAGVSPANSGVLKNGPVAQVAASLEEETVSIFSREVLEPLLRVGANGNGNGNGAGE